MKSKADYYNWLMSEHQKFTELLNRVPKLPIEEQAKSVEINEYDYGNQQKVNGYKKMLFKIEQEASRITQYL